MCGEKTITSQTHFKKNVKYRRNSISPHLKFNKYAERNERFRHCDGFFEVKSNNKPRFYRTRSADRFRG